MTVFKDVEKEWTVRPCSHVSVVDRLAGSDYRRTK